ncbi:HAMP domain-containing sensor histidine kinase [Pleomorphovibrio marinus]|uniref:HAMP domain-containing sensor histidine kinase n=1 Tax=Pleomorphovibrio marinus TaxID=2164132 RepID=UPI000E0C29AB|nr:HAMP domain-containing sensor histidine kinase [Pleomorphovibrio marinus]
MSIQKKLSLLFTVLVSGFLLIFSLIIYYSASTNRTNEFYNLLEKEALTKANLLLDTQLDANTLQTIYRQNREIIHEVEVAIYDGNGNLVYHDAVELDVVKETPEMLDRIGREGKISFLQEDWQAVGISLYKGDRQFLVTAAAYDDYGHNKLGSLLQTLLIAFSLGVLIVYLSSRYFAKKAFSPVGEMVKEADNISVSNLDLRLRVGQNKDELWQLAQTFNRMLERLEKSFESQKQFTFYMAHEFRTPLARIISDLEWATKEGRTSHEQHVTIGQVLTDAKKMARLSTGLLDFAKASFDRAEINFRSIRVDETVLEASQLVQQCNSNYRIKIQYMEADLDTPEMNLLGNAYLLTTAFSNLIENACKFSPDQTCSISLKSLSGNAELLFSDTGPGIPPEEREAIFEPFYRGKNQQTVAGNGIGLALVARILKLHNGQIEVHALEEGGTCFQVRLPLE